MRAFVALSLPSARCYHPLLAHLEARIAYSQLAKVRARLRKGRRWSTSWALERKLAAKGTFLGLWRLKVEPKRREFHICHAYA
jgi:hypothetical protein